MLNFLDQGLFASLDDFLAEFGTLTDAAQIDKLNERIRRTCCAARRATWRSRWCRSRRRSYGSR